MVVVVTELVVVVAATVLTTVIICSCNDAEDSNISLCNVLLSFRVPQALARVFGVQTSTLGARCHNDFVKQEPRQLLSIVRIAESYRRKDVFMIPVKLFV